MSYVQKFYISDTHFGHEASLGFCQRQFSSVREMDEFMVDAWNSTVKSTDIVYHLGDFSFGGAAHARSIFRRLNGRKILILGNHDIDRDGSALSYLNELDWDIAPTPALQVSDSGERLYLSHYAHRVWPSSNRSGYHFYGHTHGREPHVGLSRDVGVDVEDVAFTPRTFHYLTAALPGLQTYRDAI